MVCLITSLVPRPLLSHVLARHSGAPTTFNFKMRFPDFDMLQKSGKRMINP